MKNHPCYIHHHSLLPLLLLSPAFHRLAAADTPPVDSNDYADPNDGNVSPSMAMIVIVLVLVFFMTGCISLYIHHCSSDSSSAAVALAATARTTGLERSAIEALPTFLYSEVKELKLGKDTLECAVCLNEFTDDETLRLMPKCDHVFHSECIDAWLEGHATCPVCRADLRTVPAREEEARVPDSAEVSEVRVAVVSEAEEKESRDDNDNNNLTAGRLRFPRSNSTGHDPVSRPAGEAESGRFTLRLPAEVRRQLVARSKLKRATSQLALPRASSSRRGYRLGGGEGSGSSRYGGGVFGRSMSRLVSFKWAAPLKFNGDGRAEGSKGSKRGLTLGGNGAVTPLEGLQSSLPV